ncbi:DUF5719 family protein [Leucobacter sp. HY1908]
MTHAKTRLAVGIRASVGALVVAAAAGAVVLVGLYDAPTVERQPLALTADTTHNTARTLVCDGGFAELGADPAQPDVALPTGAPEIAYAGAEAEGRTLARAVGEPGLPQVFTASGEASIAAAQLQQVSTETLRGAVASACAEPLNEQWLIGGATNLGVTTTLTIGNPGLVPATVQVTVFDEAGEVDAVQTAGVIVAPGTQHTVSLNGYAPDRARLAVRVTSTGAPVTAALSVGHRVGLESFGVSSVDRQAVPDTELVIVGVANAPADPDVPSDAGEGDPYPVTVRAFAPGGESGTASVRALDAKGHLTALGEIELQAGAVGELLVTTWPEGAAAIEVTSSVPVVAAALGAAQKGADHDYEWFTPAPRIAEGEQVAVPVVSGGEVFVVHPGEGSVEVTVTDAKGKESVSKLSAGQAKAVKVPAGAELSATGDVYAGVRYLEGANIAAYPVLPPSQRDGTLTVYTR